ncbi:MAG: hypothetical protein ACRDL2_00850 [Gaiellaceae bacterium]
MFAPSEKEPHRYDQDVLGERRAMGDEEYRALYAGAAGKRWLLDASALYLYSPEALDAAAGIDGAHAVIALRNPVEQMASWHGLMVATGTERHGSLAEALEAESADSPFTRRYSEIARYAPYVERWLDRLGADRVHVVLFEEFAPDHGGDARERFLRDLGLDPEELGPFPHLNTYRHPAPLRLSGSAWMRRGVRTLLPARARRQLWWTATIVLTPHGERPPVPPMLRERLERDLDADVRRLGDVLGRDLHALWFGSQQPRS